MLHVGDRCRRACGLVDAVAHLQLRDAAADPIAEEGQAADDQHDQDDEHDQRIEA